MGFLWQPDANRAAGLPVRRSPWGPRVTTGRSPTFAGSTWSFPTIDAGTTNGSILDVLVDPQNVQPGQSTELLDAGEGKVHLVAVTTDLDGGGYHYEYALMNFTFERPGAELLGADRRADGLEPGLRRLRHQLVERLDAQHRQRQRHLDGARGQCSGLGDAFQLPVRCPCGARGDLRHVDAAPGGSPEAVAVRTLPEPRIGQAIRSSLVLVLALISRRRSQQGEQRADHPISRSARPRRDSQRRSKSSR